MKAVHSPPPTYHGAFQQLLDRRRQRFAATFVAQCEAIRTLVDSVVTLGPRGRVAKLKQMTTRLSGLAATVGFPTIRTRASQLERIISRAGGGDSFDPAVARNAVDALVDALSEDLAGAASSAPVIDGLLFVPVDGMSFPLARPAIEPPPRAPVERRGRKRLAPVVRMLIVDDHEMVRRGLSALLLDQFKGAVFGEAADAQEALTQLREREWDVALIDLNLPGKSGLELLKEVKLEWPNLPVLVLSGQSEDQFAVRVLKAGAGGYMSKSNAPDELIKAVRKMLGGGRYVSAGVAEQLAQSTKKDLSRAPHELLSDREYEVMSRIACGKTVTEIADELALSAKTISTYRTRLLEKLGVKNTAEIVHYALRNGIVN